MSIAENNGRTTALGGITGKGFKPGQSGNPGGRPKGVAKTVRELVGGDPEELVRILFSIAKDASARNADRISASKELLERGWGKAPVSVADDGTPQDMDAMTAEALAIVDELERMREERSAAGSRQR